METAARKPKKKALQKPDKPVKPTVVGIGASAGGLTALKRFFELVPPDTGLIFVVVIHLSPEHKSHMADLLQSSVKFPVRQVTKTVSLEPNNVYVIPPNANLSAIDTHLRLSKLEESRRDRAPIDHFFRTLASTHDGHSIGVILTGTGSDGTLGLKEIKARGGVILVQDPNDAEFDGMPQSAIATGLVDRILPLAEIPDTLLRLSRMAPHLADAGEGEDPTAPERILLPKVLAILKTRTDRDFSRYKAATLLRRIGRRMQLNYSEDFEAYLDKLREQPDEARALGDDLLITVTSFFRDPEVFYKLETEVIPHLFNGKGSADTVRVWSVGCATGEEAYSLAMILLEEAARRESPPKIQIFASDLHKRSLDSAREGVYPGDIQTDVNPDRLKRFFQQENGGYRICKEVRDTVVFAPHNLLGDPPFSRLDMIACRNLLIYLERGVQRDVIDLFHYALCPNGYLLLGSAETIDASELFRTEDKKLCIYRRRNVPAPEPRLPVFPLARSRTSIDFSVKGDQVPAQVPYQTLHHNLLERYAPPSILVSPDNKLVHLSEHAGRYLIHPGGETTLSVLKLVREELRIELQGLLQSARDARGMLDSRSISVQLNGHATPVVMHVRPAQEADQDGFVLVIFEEHQSQPASGGSSLAPSDATSDLGKAVTRIEDLEAELSNGRQRLQATIEEYETSREEMKASQEEMQSTNEELRSTMEELETSKEELQSINEELQTVNQENRHKVEELSQLSSDIQNLLTSTEIATLFLDRELRIMRFTPRLADLFNVRVADRGRPILDLTHRLGYSELRDDAQLVLERLVPIEREIQDLAGRWYLTRVLPYRSTDDRIEGVVITFVEITERKRAEEALVISERKLQTLMSTAPALIWQNDATGRNLYTNDEFLKYTGKVGTQILGDGWYEIIHPDDAAAYGKSYLAAVDTASAWHNRNRIRRRDGAWHWFDNYAQPLFDDKEVFQGHIGVSTDIQRTIDADQTLRAVQERQALLLKLSDELNALTDPIVIQQTAMKVVADHLKLSRAFYFRVERDENGWAHVVDSDYARFPNLASMVGSHSLANFGSQFFEELAHGSVLQVDDVAALPNVTPAEMESYKAVGVAAFVNIPLRRTGGYSAGITAHDLVPRAWKPEEIDLLREVGDRTWAAVERARAEVSLRLVEQNQRRLLEGMPQLVWRSKDNGFWTWSSPQWCHFTGQSLDESKERGWLNAVHPDDVHAALEAWAKAREAGSMEVDYRVRQAGSGVYRYHHTRSVPIHDDSGAVVEWLGTSTDIEDLKQAEAARQLIEEQFRLFVDNVQEYGLVQTDADGLITNWNPGAERLFGFGAAEVVGEDFSVLMTDEDQKNAVFSHELAHVKEGHRNEDARWFIRKNGSQFWARWITEPIRNEAGLFVGLAKIMRDETERARAAAFTENALAEKEELLKEVHHRVKNNLQVISSLLNLQADQIGDKQTLAAFDEARNRVASIASIHEMLYRSSTLAAIHLADYAREFAPNLLDFYGMQNRVEVVVAGDGAKLGLERAVPYGLLLNELLSNSLKHAFPDGQQGKIRVEFGEGNNFVLMRVKDNGIGLPAGFDVENVSSLGVKLVQRLARQLRGTVRFDGSEAGTSVEVQFPLTTS